MAPDSPFSAVETWIFDLDNTLYPANGQLFRQVERRIGEFVALILDVGPEEARKVQKGYLRDHGTTLRGLMTVHGVEPAPFLDYVEQIDLSELPDGARLDAALKTLPGRKLVYTNASRHHAGRVLDHLGVGDHFEAIHDIIDADYVPKPDPAPFAAMIQMHRIEPSSAAMIEDIARNLKPAADLGMKTIWVKGSPDWAADGAGEDHIHHVAADLLSFLQTLAGRGDPPARG